MDTQPKTRTITLTDRPPVKIGEANWPEIAHGRYHEYEGQVERQSNRTTDINIRVRAHDATPDAETRSGDGRHIVYGVDAYDTHHQHERGWTHKAGVIVPDGGDVVAAIRAVGDTLMASDGSSAAAIRAAVLDCIADLPAEAIN